MLTFCVSIMQKFRQFTIERTSHSKPNNYTMLNIVPLPFLSRVRRYRRHLIPLTDRDGSDDSDEEEELDLREPAFMVRTSFDCLVITVV